MIGFVRGSVLHHSDGKVVIAVGADPAESCVGYQVIVPQGAQYVGLLPGKRVDLHIYTHVREDHLDLYGFLTAGEKELFLSLLTVTGIGPKGALGLLSKVDPIQLIETILDEDKESLGKVPGIGKKTAERVVIELAGTLRKRVEAGAFHGLSVSPLAVRGDVDETSVSTERAAMRDAKEALVGLGYRETEFLAHLKKVFEEQVVPRQAEQLIRATLKRLG